MDVHVGVREDGVDVVRIVFEGVAHLLHLAVAAGLAVDTFDVHS